MPKHNHVVGQPESTSGRDEMNLAEFPIALLSSREPEDSGPLVFETRLGKLTITATQGPREKGNGLPTASDTDVLIGLLQLTKRANNFTEPVVYFSRYELLRLIRWPDGTKSYRRLRAALKRWAKVSLDYEKSWYDNRKKCRVDATFHILNSVIVYERPGKESSGDQASAEPQTSRFTWGTEFFKSCQENYLKRLDLGVYFSLESAATKQLYRFLDKHFYDASTLTYDLKELAIVRIGFSTNYTVPRIKEKLTPCLAELEGIGFIEKAEKEERYTKTGHGKWDITFRKKAREERPLVKDATEPEPPFARELISRDVTPVTARKLVRDFPAETISLKLEVFDWLMAKKDKRISKNPAGYLAKSIRDDYATPNGFETKAKVEAKRLAKQQADQELAAMKIQARSEDMQKQAEKVAVDAHLASLTSEQRVQLEREAYAASELDTKLWGRVIVRDHVKNLLGIL